MANSRNIFRKIMAGAFFTELLAAMHPPQKSLALPQRKLRCLQFAARLVSRVNVRRGSFWRTGFKRFTRFGFSHRAAPRLFAASSRQPSQVLQSAKDFGCSEMSRVAMRPKRLQRRGFSQASARWRT
jgi:hypothetical protein